MAPPPPNAIADALAAGSLVDLLHALQALRVIDAAHHTSAQRADLRSAWRAHDAALHDLLGITVPIGLLARTEPSDSPLHRHLATVRANLAASAPSADNVVPPGPPLPLPPAPDADALADAAARVADAAAADADELAELWATLAPGAGVTHATLPAALRAAQRRADGDGEADGECEAEAADAATLELAIAATRREAARQRRGALAATLRAVEADTAERAGGPRAASAARASLLEARAAATAAKTRLVRAEVEELTYAPEKVAALRHVDGVLMERETMVAARLRDASARLARYRALGPRFELAADEFARVSAKLEQKVWSRNELGLGEHDGL